MLKKLTILCFLFLINSLYAQSEFNWNDYLPDQEVDSIVFIESDDRFFNNKIYDYLYRNKEIGQAEIDSLLEFSTVNMVSEKELIQEFVSYCPKDSCEGYSVSRCHPFYRNAIIFYNNKKPIYSLFVCLSCNAIQSIPKTHQARCLTNNRKGLFSFIELYFKDREMYDMINE